MKDNNRDDGKHLPAGTVISPSSSTSNLCYCSFCGKPEHEVTKLIAGPSVFICNECVELCNEIFVEDRQTKIDEDVAKLVEDVGKLKKYVLRESLGQLDTQPGLRENITRVIINQRRRINRAASIERLNALVAGPSIPDLPEGIRRVAAKLGLPMVQIDVTRLTGPGYFGDKRAVDALVAEARSDLAKASFGVILIERIDWLCAPRDRANRSRLQTALATLIGGTVETLSDGQHLSTADIQFIACGEFERPANLSRVREAIGIQGMSEALLKQFHSVFPTDPIDEDTISLWLDGDDSNVGQLERYTLIRGRKSGLKLTDAARAALVAETVRRGEGIRTLQILLEDLIIQQSYSRPSKKIIIDEAEVETLLQEIGKPLEF